MIYKKHYNVGLIFGLIAVTCPGVATAADAESNLFSLAARQGFLKVVVEPDGAFVASWRGDVVQVDKERLSTRQFPLDYSAYEVDAFSFDVAPTGLFVTRTSAYDGAIDKYILFLPKQDLKADPLADQPLVRDMAKLDAHPTIKYMKANIRTPFSMLPLEHEQASKPLPFTDLSTSATGLIASFEFDGSFYIWELTKEAKDGDDWVSRRKVPSRNLGSFVCIKVDDTFEILASDGRRFRVGEAELTPIPQPVASTRPTAGDYVAVVVDRSKAAVEMYRLFWKDGAFVPETGELANPHLQIAAAATKAVSVLAKAPSVTVLKEFERKRLESKKAAAEKEEIDLNGAK